MFLHECPQLPHSALVMKYDDECALSEHQSEKAQSPPRSRSPETSGLDIFAMHFSSSTWLKAVKENV